ncbi:AN1-type zinc finger protein 1-like [Planococcus citri]|uniref:AN1-type zinc finger protein 1-like n=1 Tax=Planococcus citri TaxID=170843 RepID=UPI0031F895B5
MEFPELGQQCSLQDCKQLDFLPFTCANCQQIFCKNHYITSAHDCKCLNEFFRKPEPTQPSEFFTCNKEDCKDRSPIALPCPFCKQHFCVSHRHHGCKDDLMNSERKKLEVEKWKKPKEQYRAAQENCDRKVEKALRKAETTQLQPMAQKIRLMKIKGKALGDGKIPADNRIYFSVHPPATGENSDLKPAPLYTSKDWSVGRTIDLFSKKMKVPNKNNEPNEPKLRLFKLSDGALISSTTDIIMANLIDKSILNGDSLILNYVSEEVLKSGSSDIPDDLLQKYKSAAV